jgi:uncharacterized protein
VSVFADSSALVKLYVDEAGHQAVRALLPIAVSQLARVEVPAAFWRKYRIGEIDAEHARVLTAEFEADYFGTIEEPPRFAVVVVTENVLDEAVRLCSRFPLRAYDAVQLGSALLAHAADPGLAAMAVFDTAVRNAAAAEGLPVTP